KKQVEKHHADFRQTVVENLDRGMEEGLYRNDLDPEIVADFYTGMMFMIIDTTVFPAQDRNLSDILRQHSEYHFNGVANQFGRDRLEKYLRQESLD
ncbi:MAG: hypothetical protein AAFN92_16710, partial [Bacteroidota bacterium]